jgi:hypothetical protein
MNGEAMAESKGLRNRVAALFEHRTREGNPGEQANALEALLKLDPTREFVSEAIAYIRNPDAFIGAAVKDAVKSAAHGRFDSKFDEAERALLQSRIDRLEWRLNFHERHEAHLSSKLDERYKALRYHEKELAQARVKIRAFERKLAALNGEPTDTDALLAKLAATELEIVRVKTNRKYKDQQVREWRREIEFVHEYIALLKTDPAAKTPDRQWPPPSWRPTEEADPDAATVKELRAENERLQAENTYLKVERAKAADEVQSWRAKYFDRSEEQAEIDRLNAEIERLTAELERLDERDDDPREMVWVITYNHEPESDNYQVFIEKDAAEKYYNHCDVSHPGGASLQSEPGTNFDFRYCRVDDGEMLRGRTGGKPPKRVAAEPNYSQKISNPIPRPSAPEPIKPEPVASPQATPEPASHGRGRHFGAYPDSASMERIRGLSARLRLDNTALLRSLIDNEYANPPDVLPPRRKRANRIHHFGCYPDGATWAKIRKLLEQYRIDNTELLSYLAEKAS